MMREMARAGTWEAYPMGTYRHGDSNPGTNPSSKACQRCGCHTRKVIRGLLCDRCNRGIGFFDDNHATLTAAVEYVQREGVMPHAR
jgi:hypothetical protein